MNQDKYVKGMYWGSKDFSLTDLSNYRKYQFSLIKNYIGKNILEVGSGDRGFTQLLVNSFNDCERIISIEPSITLLSNYEGKYVFPDYVNFQCIDLFDMNVKDTGYFDTIIFIHVLEHIENDRNALNKAYELLKKNGNVLIEVPALPFLYSPNDELLGHYRRYDKKTLRSIIDKDKYKILDIWYQDIFGVFGSLYYFKIKKIKLKSDTGVDLVKNQGKIYDKYLIPFQSLFENFFRLPLGLSLTAVLKKI
ncbi:MAG: class I SAM-dependent methyltransferase [Ignavibacteriae bacterium]|nr:MAG: class I SAM-dependent methyltransferase [Ignavibacteriota bacterium]